MTTSVENKRRIDAKYRERNREAIRLRTKLWQIHGKDYHRHMPQLSRRWTEVV